MRQNLTTVYRLQFFLVIDVGETNTLIAIARPLIYNHEETVGGVLNPNTSVSSILHSWLNVLSNHVKPVKVMSEGENLCVFPATDIVREVELFHNCDETCFDPTKFEEKLEKGKKKYEFVNVMKHNTNSWIINENL
jgi:hypothetical protein